MARGLRLGPNRPALEEATPVSNEEVAQVAYQLFEQRGRAHGFDQQDWFRAEQIVQQRRNRASRN